MSKKDYSYNGSLWNNDMVNNAIKNMSPEELEKYKKIGESIYKDIDYETSQVIDQNNSLPPFLSDAVNYINEMLKSGLHPSMLEQNEINVLEEVYGKQWYLKWNFTENDLKEINVSTKKE